MGKTGKTKGERNCDCLRDEKGERNWSIRGIGEKDSMDWKKGERKRETEREREKREANGRGEREGRGLKRMETGRVGKREKEGRLRAICIEGGRQEGRQEGRWAE